MTDDDKKLVYVGKIISLEAIENADFIVSAIVVCGQGGKWKGIVRKVDFAVDDLCVVYLPDSLVPESSVLSFLKDSGWRVKIRRFRGAASEVVITKIPLILADIELFIVGLDVTKEMGVTKYHKPVPAHLNGIAKGSFPDFIPKTDEPNYQSHPELVEELIGQFYYVTEKMDGSSTTAFRWKGQFGVCSRNLELERNENNGYWQVVKKYDIENWIPEGIAIQWETCGPGIQGNPAGLSEIDGFAFSAYDIKKKRYLEMTEFWSLIGTRMPLCQVLSIGRVFSKRGIETRGEGYYKPSGNPREGVVIRSQVNLPNGKPISFKVINLDYDR